MNTATQTAKDKAPKAERFHLWIYPDLRERLEAYSRETGCPMGEFFRRAATEKLERYWQTVRPA
jgi:hypothetical protein